ncbi:ABC transporter permease [Aureimonas altamirensis]|uniref:ABC transporter permease n=1 Tax=Aureimonas altamirensis TaxID=370622 RepID=UPI001E4D0D3D|nr:ABC transporter permease [Aureimonas altamirensis]UHD46434.1 ABC transporter permease [Aureimonas altamirensis]
MPIKKWLPSRKALSAIGSIVGMFIIWEICCRAFNLPVYLLPAPSAVFAASYDSWPQLLGHLLATSRTVLYGFIASVVISIPLAMLIASSRIISEAIYPILVVTQAIPKIALAPILLVAFGAGETPRIIVTFLIAFFPLVASSVAGMLATPPELIELGRACRAGPLQEMLRIRLPFSVPFVFSGLRVAAALAVVGAVSAEFVGANAGLGFFIQSSMAYFRSPLAFSALVLLAMLGIVVFQAVNVIERLFFPWSANEGRS